MLLVKAGLSTNYEAKGIWNERGCRIFFVDGLSDLHAYIDYLEKQPIFVQWGEDECHTS